MVLHNLETVYSHWLQIYLYTGFSTKSTETIYLFWYLQKVRNLENYSFAIYEKLSFSGKFSAA